MKRLFTISHDTFDMETLIAVGVSDKKITKWIEKNTKLKADDDFMSSISCDGLGRTVRHGGFSMLRLDHWDGTNRNIAHLAHEAFHLAEFTFDRINIKHDVETSGEAFAYFIQHTVEQVLDGLS